MALPLPLFGVGPACWYVATPGLARPCLLEGTLQDVGSEPCYPRLDGEKEEVASGHSCQVMENFLSKKRKVRSLRSPVLAFVGNPARRTLTTLKGQPTLVNQRLSFLMG